MLRRSQTCPKSADVLGPVRGSPAGSEFVKRITTPEDCHLRQDSGIIEPKTQYCLRHNRGKSPSGIPSSTQEGGVRRAYQT